MAQIAKLIQYEFGISKTWLLEGKGDMLIDSAQEKSVDVQKMVVDIVAGSTPLYGKKLLPEEEKFAEIKAYMETIQAAGPVAQALFNEKFVECFKSFSDWSETRSHATTNKDEDAPSQKSHD